MNSQREAVEAPALAKTFWFLFSFSLLPAAPESKNGGRRSAGHNLKRRGHA
jgi:hypothetical protein